MFLIGVKDLWWDPGSVVSQDLVVFATAGPTKIVLKAPQVEFRGVQGSSVKKSYADSILWSADVGSILCLCLCLRECFVLLCFVLLCCSAFFERLRLEFSDNQKAIHRPSLVFICGIISLRVLFLNTSSFFSPSLASSYLRSISGIMQILDCGFHAVCARCTSPYSS